MARVITRFAPSPTGFMHVGSVRTALYAWLWARKNKGTFILRIEDTDKARSTEDSTKAIFQGLSWLGLEYDNGVVYQGQRASDHNSKAFELVAAGQAYPCFCTRERIESLKDANGQIKYDGHCTSLSFTERRELTEGDKHPFVVRFKVPEDGETGWNDVVHGPISFPNKDLGGDFIILRSDGSPIYNLAVVCDDIYMGITHILRGDDHISNTPKQILLYKAFGVDIPQFGHLPMIHGEDGKKLSKRHGATAVGDYAGKGIVAEAMNNFLALMGWSPGHDKEIMSMPEMIELFSVDGLSSKPAIFDTKKLAWMNGEYIRNMNEYDLVKLVLRRMDLRLEAIGQHKYELIHNLTHLFKVRVTNLEDLTNEVSKVFKGPSLRTESGCDPDVLKSTWTALKPLDWEPSTLKETVEKILTSREGKPKWFYEPMRLALTGQPSSPPIADLMLALGKKETLTRIAVAAINT